MFREILGVLAATRKDTHGAMLLALDLTTGLNCDTADVDPACVAADVTVALGYPKRGHLDFPGADYVGRLEVADIGIPPGLDDDVHVSLLTYRVGTKRTPRASGRLPQGHFRSGQ